MTKATTAKATKPAVATKDSTQVVVHTAYDNEAEDGVTCVCTLTFADGAKATGSAQRTENLAEDQAAARASALASLEA